MIDPIGKFFSIEEVVASQTAARRGIDNAGALTPEFRENAEALARRILDPEREHWGAPARISSWFRCPALNAAIGGAASSQHQTAAAADHTIKGVTLVEHFNWLAFESGLPFDQIIFEFDSWVHVSFNRLAPPRGERLRIRYGGHYEPIDAPLAS